MTYTVKEIFMTLQGEGMNTGRPAVLCRFSGCNLWSGRESDRARAVCRFCDTDFVGTDGPEGGKYRSAGALAEAVAGRWPRDVPAPFVVMTGGEPLLQVDGDLLSALHKRDFEIALETNGTLLPPPGFDWICVSPKSRAPLRLRTGDELKLVYPQPGLDPTDLEGLAFDHFLLQPMDGPNLAENMAAVSAYCQRANLWHASVQLHKLIGIP